MNLLENKIALVTGAASGIGKATAELFAAEGARLILTDINEAELARLGESLSGKAIHIAGDITSEALVEELVTLAVEHYGRLDCAVNAAGVSNMPTSIDQMELDEWRRVIDINLTSVFICVKHQLRQMRKQQAGAIVNIASGAGLIAVPTMANYAAAKHGVLGLTKTAALEVAAEGIRVNAVLPGSIQTPMLENTMALGEGVEKMIMKSIPCGRFGRAEEVAQNCAWLCSDRASYVSGESMLVDHATVCR